jgi:hypothetical protein
VERKIGDEMKKFIPPDGARRFKGKGRIGNKTFSTIFWVEPNTVRTDYPKRCKHKRVHRVIEASLTGELKKAASKRRRENYFGSLNVCACDGKLIGGKS